MIEPTKSGADEDGPERIRVAARALIKATFAVLAREHVIPTPHYHPYIKVGRDYFGGSIGPLAEFAALESLLHEFYPERFADPIGGHHSEFPNTYIFSLLEACVARCGLERLPFEVTSAPVDRLITELVAVLDAAKYEMVCCREVSHLTTHDSQPLNVGNVEIIPEVDTRSASTLVHVASSFVPGTVGAFNRDEPRIYSPPKSMLVVRTKVAVDSEPFAIVSRLTTQIEQFLLLCRLVHAATTHSCWQVCGAATLVARISPQYTRYGPEGFMGPLVRRTTCLSIDDETAFANIQTMLDEAQVKRTNMVATSFDLALERFLRTYSPASPFDNIVDLATALEALLTGSDTGTEAISLRLKSRAAALLWTTSDPASAIFNDIGRFYGLRSTLVHGGKVKESDLRADIGKISTITDTEMFGTATGHAVDRMRDIVRRAFLARLCLAEVPDPVWPFEGSTAVDRILSDEDQRSAWRTKWRARMSEIGAASAADPARPGVDFISPDDL
jgi:hypothetical protein